jgi:hypothetical protein
MLRGQSHRVTGLRRCERRLRYHRLRRLWCYQNGNLLFRIALSLVYLRRWSRLRAWRIARQRVAGYAECLWGRLPDVCGLWNQNVRLDLRNSLLGRRNGLRRLSVGSSLRGRVLHLSHRRVKTGVAFSGWCFGELSRVHLARPSAAAGDRRARLQRRTFLRRDRLRNERLLVKCLPLFRPGRRGR